MSSDAERPAEPPVPARERLVLGAHWGLLAFFVGLGGYHLLGMVIALVFTGTYSGPVPFDLPAAGPILLLAFLPTLALGLGPALGSWRWGRGLRLDFGLVPSLRDLRVGLSCGLFALFAGYLLSFVMLVVYGEEQLADAPLRELTEGLGGNVLWLVVAMLIMVLLAPLAEELLVRGSLWSGLEHYRVPPWAILVLTAAVFAYLHSEPVRTVPLFGQGLAIGAARMITGRIGASMVAHATNNLPPAVLLLVLGA